MKSGILSSLFSFPVSQAAMEYLSSVGQDAADRYHTESVERMWPERAFIIIADRPATKTGQSFRDLYGIQWRRDLYEPKLKELCDGGHYLAAINLLSGLDVYHDEYLNSILLPSMFIDTTNRNGLANYLKNRPQVAEKLLAKLESMLYDLKCSNQEIVTQTPSMIQTQIKWINKIIFWRTGSSQEHLKSLESLCSLRSRGYIFTEIFYARLDSLMLDDSRLIRPLVSQLVSLKLMNDAWTVLERYRYDIQLLSYCTRNRMEIHRSMTMEVNFDAEVKEEDSIERVGYEMVTTEKQFLRMLPRLRSCPVLVITCRASKEHHLYLVQINAQGHIFLVDPIEGHFSMALRKSLVAVLRDAQLLLGNTKSEEFLRKCKFFAVAAAAVESNVNVVNMVAFYAFVKEHPPYKSLFGRSLLKLTCMEEVLMDLRGQFVDKRAKYASYQQRPLIQVALDYAAVQAAMVWDSFMELDERLKSCDGGIQTALLEFMPTRDAEKQAENNLDYWKSVFDWANDSERKEDFTKDLDYSDLGIIF